MDDKHTLASLGARIRKAREALGLNLNEVARLSGISAPALSLIETGKRDLRLTSLVRIAKAIRIEPAELLSDRAASASSPLAPGPEPYDLAEYA